MARVFGPDNATLTVRTKRKGAAAKAGHDLLIEVTFVVRDARPRRRSRASRSTADSRSLRVLEGTGGIQALDDDDKAGIAQTIDEEVLVGTPIEFRSTVGRGRGGRGRARARGQRHPVSFELAAGEDGRLTGAPPSRRATGA